MKVKKITKQQIFDLLEETLTDTNKIGTLSIHLPHDPKVDDYVFNYVIEEPKVEGIPQEVVP
ncbi:hypothetical protein LCGC14_0908110 [marine sediment metagenome]|uniref:Uncharacterized protein n=1 Tax=marine sediment metagenome TaxID=412755 RepID=A0A0F9NZ37_9ZZZZ